MTSDLIDIDDTETQMQGALSSTRITREEYDQLHGMSGENIGTISNDIVDNNSDNSENIVGARPIGTIFKRARIDLSGLDQ